MSIFRHTALSAVSTAVATVGRLGLTIFIARHLGPSGYGSIVWLQWCAESIAQVASLGVNHAVSRYGPEYLMAPGGVRARYVRMFLMGVAVCFAAALLLGPVVLLLALKSDQHGLLLAGVAWASTSLAFGLTQAITVGMLRFDAMLASNVAFVVGGFAAALLMPADVSRLAFVFPIANVVGAAVAGAALFVRRVPHATRASLALEPRAILTYALNTWIGFLAAYFLWTRGELSVLQGLETRSGIALYGAATTLAGLVNQSVNLLQGANTPHLSRIWALGQKQECARLVTALSRVSILAAGASATFLVAFADEVIRLTFGPAYAGGAVLLVVMGVGATATGLGVANMLLQIMSEGRFQRDSNLIGAAALIASAYVLFHAFGNLGVALARALCFLAMGIAPLVVIARSDFRDMARRLLRHWSFCAALMAPSVALSMAHAPFPLRLGAAVLTVGAMCLLYLGPEERAVLTRLRVTLLDRA